MQSSEAAATTITESKAAKRLFKKVNSMIQKMDEVVVKLEKKETDIKNTLGEQEKAEEKLVFANNLYDLAPNSAYSYVFVFQ